MKVGVGWPTCIHKGRLVASPFLSISKYFHLNNYNMFPYQKVVSKPEDHNLPNNESKERKRRLESMNVRMMQDKSEKVAEMVVRNCVDVCCVQGSTKSGGPA